MGKLSVYAFLYLICPSLSWSTLVKRILLSVSGNDDIESIFTNSFGIISPNGDQPEKIVLSFDREQGNYIKALPIHHSQKVVSENDKEIIFELYLVPTFDFEKEIISYGQRVKVIKPLSLKQTIYKEIINMGKNYA